MPTAVTHQLLAEEVYKSLPEERRKEIFSLPHYYFGAQGCDVCFPYDVFRTASDNFGRFLHGNEPLLFFNILLEEAKKNKEVRSYAYGYITHYAADTVFHPYIYDKTGGGRIVFHHAIEHACDGVLLGKLRGKNLFFYRLPKPKNLSLEGVYNVYARYARESGWGDTNERDFEKAVKRYYAFNAARTPLFRKKYAEKAEELFSASEKRSLRLIDAFAAGKDGTLDAEDFGRHYLTGKIV